MYEYIKGTLATLNPSYAVIDNSGIGYFINISLQTYTQLQHATECKLFCHQVVREDAHLLFGFADLAERELFRYLITVSGIGANTARTMLSSMASHEIENAIRTGNIVALKSIKGIGAKTAERIIIELRDKVGKLAGTSEMFSIPNQALKQESMSALVMLGFAKNQVEKAIDKILSDAKNTTISVEDIIKLALKNL